MTAFQPAERAMLSSIVAWVILAFVFELVTSILNSSAVVPSSLSLGASPDKIRIASSLLSVSSVSVFVERKKYVPARVHELHMW